VLLTPGTKSHDHIVRLLNKRLIHFATALVATVSSCAVFGFTDYCRRPTNSVTFTDSWFGKTSV